MWLMFTDLCPSTQKEFLDKVKVGAEAGNDDDRNILHDLNDGGDAQIGYIMDRKHWLVLDKSNFE